LLSGDKVVDYRDMQRDKSFLNSSLGEKTAQFKHSRLTKQRPSSTVAAKEQHFKFDIETVKNDGTATLMGNRGTPSAATDRRLDAKVFQ
jgi:hypothetical protein